MNGNIINNRRAKSTRGLNENALGLVGDWLRNRRSPL